jgi:hypothetical protein
LAWCAADDQVDRSFTDTCRPSDFSAGKRRNVSAQGRAVGKVKFVRSRVDRIDLYGCNYVKTCLLEAQAHSASTGKKVNRYRSPHVLPSLQSRRIDEFFDIKKPASFVRR